MREDGLVAKGRRRKNLHELGFGAVGEWGMESRGEFLEQLLSVYGISFVDKEEGL